jgi:hypothetical protein
VSPEWWVSFFLSFFSLKSILRILKSHPPAPPPLARSTLPRRRGSARRAWQPYANHLLLPSAGNVNGIRPPGQLMLFPAQDSREGRVINGSSVMRCPRETQDQGIRKEGRSSGKIIFIRQLIDIKTIYHKYVNFDTLYQRLLR